MPLRTILAAVGLLFLAVLTWFLARSVGDLKEPAPMLIAGGLVILGLLAWGAVDRFRKARANKSAAEGGVSPHDPGSASSGSASEIASIEDGLRRGLHWLKESKLTATQAGKGPVAWLGRSAVAYQLPWFLLMGPPGSGKTSLVRASDLDFPFSDPEERPGVRPVDVTRGCAMRFANEAFLIDTAGRYVTREEDKEVWLGLLHLLKKFRRKKPIDGVVVVLNIAEILEAGDEAILNLAKQLRGKLDDLSQKLGVLVPVYLVFNKCDLLEGFDAFFGDMSKEERSQVWGGTLPSTSDGQKAEIWFEEEFGRLCQNLRPRRINRLKAMAGESDKIYVFPLELAALRVKLSDFVGTLFRSNPFMDNPIFRGFYFTSALQQGQPYDLVFSRLAHRLGLPERPVYPSAKPKPGYGYFIKQLLTQVIFTDRAIGRQSSQARRATRIFRAVSAAVGALAVIFSLWGMTGAFLTNNRLLDSVQKAAGDLASHPESAPALEPLREPLQNYDESGHKGLVRSFEWGMHQGGDVFDRGRRFYAGRLKEVLLNPSARSVQDRLVRLRTTVNYDASCNPPQPSVADPSQPMTASPYLNDHDYYLYFNLLKTYIMASDMKTANETFLAKESPWIEFWKKPGLSEDLSAKQLAFYAHRVAAHEDTDFGVSADGELVACTRKILRTKPPFEREYERITNECNAKTPDLTLTEAFKGKDPNILSGSHSVRGSFTRKGWENCVQNALVEAGKRLDTFEEDWVLGNVPGPPAEASAGKTAALAKLQKRYFDDYAGKWQEFLSRIVAANYADLSDAERKLQGLSNRNESPFPALFESVTYNTKLGVAAAADLEKKYQPLHQFLAAAKEPQGSPAATYLEALNGLYKELHARAGNINDPSYRPAIESEKNKALNVTVEVTRNFDSGLMNAVRSLLEQPIRNVLPPSLEPQIGSISVTVVTLQGGPLAKAKVELSPLKMLEVTDGRGKCKFDKVPFGTHIVDASYGGVSADPERVALDGGNRDPKIVLRIATSGPSAGGGGGSALKPPAGGAKVGVITGRVTDEQRRSLGGATVTIAALSRSATTGADGRFRLDNIPLGTSLTVEVRKEGFAYSSRSGVMVSAEKSSFDLELSLTASSSSSSASQPAADNKFTISGKVIDKLGKPLEGAVVTIKGTGVKSAPTGKSGIYTIQKAPAGSQVLESTFAIGSKTHVLNKEEVRLDIIRDLTYDFNVYMYSFNVEHHRNGPRYTSTTLYLFKDGFYFNDNQKGGLVDAAWGQFKGKARRKEKILMVSGPFVNIEVAGNSYDFKTADVDTIVKTMNENIR
ncbi:MAG: type VI secretion system membrane subunit TssM [Acidobacteria bacterium]|nr:type VI secretion system membrane subunit TssM [Acidobacteriota bacterium]MBI3655372.1 type VI secretion system membrane subunit TssM [Acidobacteriota bacterium]